MYLVRFIIVVVIFVHAINCWAEESTAPFTHLYTIDVTKNQFQVVTKLYSVVSRPTWLHDDSQLAFSANYQDNKEIILYDFEAEQFINLTNSVDDEWGADWGKKLKKFAYVGIDNKGVTQIYLNDAEFDDTPECISCDEISGYKDSPVWSEDNQYLSYVSLDYWQSHFALLEYDLKERTTKVLLESESEILFPSYAQEDKIAFAHDQYKQGYYIPKIFNRKTNAESHAIQGNLTAWQDGYLFLDYSPVVGTLLFSMIDETQLSDTSHYIYSYSQDDAQLQNISALLKDKGGHYFPRFSENGERIGFVHSNHAPENLVHRIQFANISKELSKARESIGWFVLGKHGEIIVFAEGMPPVEESIAIIPASSNTYDLYRFGAPIYGKIGTIDADLNIQLDDRLLPDMKQLRDFGTWPYQNERGEFIMPPKSQFNISGAENHEGLKELAKDKALGWLLHTHMGSMIAAGKNSGFPEHAYLLIDNLTPKPLASAESGDTDISINYALINESNRIEFFVDNKRLMNAPDFYWYYFGRAGEPVSLHSPQIIPQAIEEFLQ